MSDLGLPLLFDEDNDVCEKPLIVVKEKTEVVESKRVSKLTEKALLVKISELEKRRKSLLNKAANVKEQIYKLMSENGSCDEVKGIFSTYEILVNDAKDAHECLMEFLPASDKEKNEVWFKAKLLSVTDCVESVTEYFKSSKHTENDQNVHELKNADDIKPSDSASNVSFKSSKSNHSTRSSTLRAQTEAKKAALIAKETALQEKHKLQQMAMQHKQEREAKEMKEKQEWEAQQEEIRKKIETVELEAEIKAADAELAVLEQYSDGMNSYLSKTRKSITTPTTKPKPVQTEITPATKPKILQTRTFAPTVQPNIKETQNLPAYSPVQLPEQNDSLLVQFLQKQNDISDLLIQQQNAAQLPARDIPIFDGDPLKFTVFMQAFKHCVEDKCATKGDCLYFLERYTRGRPKELIQSCLHMSPEVGFERAKTLLNEHFGNETRLTNAYMHKVLTWPVIKVENVSLLQDYALFLRGCNNAMSDLTNLNELNMSSNMKTVISKLPYKMKEQFRNVACDIQEAYHRRPNFNDIVNFVERQLRIISGPIFGDIQTQNVDRAKPVKPTELFKPKPRHDNFAVNVCQTHNSQTKEKSERTKESNANTFKCLFCSQTHTLNSCQQFIEKQHRDKISFLKEKGACFKCLRLGHFAKQCNKPMSCSKCKLSHPTALHTVTKVDKAVSTNVIQPCTTANTTVSSQSCVSHTGAGVCGKLSILPVTVKSKKGNKLVQTYAFLDNGSTSTFCTENLMKKLNLTGKKSKISLLTMSPITTTSTYILNDLEITSLDGTEFYDLPVVYTQRQMPVNTANVITKEDIKQWTYLCQVDLPEIDAEVDLLIGTDASKFHEPWEVVNSQGEGPYATRTLLGWVVSGSSESCCDKLDVHNHISTVNRTSVLTLESLLEKQYKHDFKDFSKDEKEELSQDDKKFLQIMEESVKFEYGHYSLKLPFKNPHVDLPNNRCVAQQRLSGLKRKMERNETFHKEYTEFMEEVLNNGFAELVPESELKTAQNNIYYIPHHGVYHPRKGKLRVVFDCGAKFKGTSLNDELLQGPNLTSTLIGVLIRFRQEPLAFMSDIKSMFYQVRVADEHKDFLRFLWWPDGDLTKEAVEYRMTVHLFGAVSSPSCSCYALRRTAEDHCQEFASEVVQTVNKNFYVDDCLKSLPSVGEAIQVAHDLSDLCHKGGFHLTQWISNNRTVLQAIPEQDHSKHVTVLDLDKDQLPTERALGLQWCLEKDHFIFSMDEKIKLLTRRGMLSVIASVYDPLGYLAPATLQAKLLLQELCRRNHGWDEEIPQQIKQQWINWLSELEKLSAFQADRCIKPADFGPPVKAQLHHFADASNSGYGTVSYLRLENQTGQVHASFLLSKARVAPLKPVTIPRLELTAAVLATQVDKLIKAELQLPCEESYFWSDSCTVLKYINNENKRFRTFVANRISIIRKASNPDQWHYIPTKENPADITSRGVSIHKLLNTKTWLTGPEFLWNVQQTWQKSQINFEEDSEIDDPEIKAEVFNCSTQMDIDLIDKFITHFSEWNGLKTAVAWILKIKETLRELSNIRKNLQDKTPAYVEQELQKAKSCKKNAKISTEDLNKAECAVISFSQKQRFPNEINALYNGKSIKRNSHIYKLNPVLQDGLLRVGGRLSKTAMPEESKHPIILAKDQHVSSLIIKDVHEQVKHTGRNHVLSKLREKFWITHANAATRKILSKCVFCKRFKGKLCQQKMADLPRERITPDLPPFTNVGVDYFGPIEVKYGRSHVKRYGVIFSCMVSRAVHIEVAHSLDTDSCISAIRRFMCRRGPVSHFRSDNGTNFTSAEKELKKMIADLNHDKIEKTLLYDDIKWTFNPPYASHHGGAWESMIRLIRKVLCSVLHQQALTDEALLTVLCEAEVILNDRPVTKVSDDPNDLEPLTPNHLLTLKRKPTLPPGVFDQQDLYARRRWKQSQYISDLFWKRWSKEYLSNLQERQKWNQLKRNLKVGDIVLIADSTAPRNSWMIGRIITVFPDTYGVVRSVEIKTKASTIKRPITKLCMLLENDP